MAQRSQESSRDSGIDIAALSVADAVAGIKGKRFTARQLVTAALERIDMYNAGYNAIIFMNPDALADADAVDARIASGEEVGPLVGVPVVAKDVVDVAGLPTTGGWDRLCPKTGGMALIPRRDAPVARRLRDAGAIIVGKTNVPLMSFSANDANNSWAGPTYNAATPAHMPGGSSTGTATAIAAGFALAGLAAEAGGSIQNPAAAQALAAIKPTFGLTPNSGVFPLAASTRDTIGPIAKTVRDAAILLDVMAGYTSDDPKTVACFGNIPRDGYAAALRKGALAGKRLGLYGPGWKARECMPDTGELYSRALEKLRALGAETIADPFAGSGFVDIAIKGYDYRGDEFVAYDFQQYLNHLGLDAPKTLAELAAMTGEDVFRKDGPYQARWEVPGYQAALANPNQAPDMSEFTAARNRYIEIFDKVMSEHNLDAMVLPQAFREVPKMFGKGGIASTTISEINIGGFPAVVVPAGYYESGCPFALIFVGRLWDEANLLAFAHDFEQATLARKAPVLVEKPG